MRALVVKGELGSLDVYIFGQEVSVTTFGR